MTPILSRSAVMLLLHIKIEENIFWTLFESFDLHCIVVRHSLKKVFKAAVGLKLM